MTTLKVSESTVNEYLKTQPPKVDRVKIDTPPQPIAYYKPETDPPANRQWSYSTTWTAALWTIFNYTFDEEVILTGIYLNTYGSTYLLMRINTVNTTFSQLSGGGLGYVFIPLPNWHMRIGDYLILNGYLATVNDGITVTFVGIPKIH